MNSAHAPSDIEGSIADSLHVVLGAGQVGARLRDLLLARGLRVRVVRRGTATPSGHPRLEQLSGDVTDLAFAERATAGADVVYDCMNPAYHEWPRRLLPMARGAIHGASHAGAKLVALDCLYMYGRVEGPMTEETPVNPCSKKGELRARLGELRLGAHARGDVRVAIGRASDFFGADLPFSGFGPRFFERILAGSPGECMGDPDMPHAYTYVDDVASALMTLGEHDRALGNVWHLPTAPAESTRALTRRIGRALGVVADSQQVPKWLLRAVGLFSPFVREVVEMTYQWESPFLLDDSRFRAAFGYGATDVDRAVESMAVWARGRFGGGGAVGGGPRSGKGLPHVRGGQAMDHAMRDVHAAMLFAHSAHRLA
jgi:nucleoside-diphosphate-sugar epimerase